MGVQSPAGTLPDGAGRVPDASAGAGPPMRRGPRDADIIQKTEDGRAREPGHPAPRGGREEALRGPGTPARRPAPVPPPSRDPDGTPPHPTCRRAPP